MSFASESLSLTLLTMDNQSRPIEKDTGDLVRVGSELLASEKSVEDQASVWEPSWLYSQGLNGS